jgi:CheY-like chemotaxis protein
MTWASDDRRGTVRASVTATAYLVIEERLQGPYRIENLSAGGVLLGEAVSLNSASEVRLLLVLPKRDLLSMRARLARSGRDKTALAFVNLAADAEDRIHEAVLSNLEQAFGPGVLVVDSSREVRRRLAGELSQLGCRVRLSATPLEAVRLIEDLDLMLDVVMVDLFFGGADGSALLELAAKERPGIRRVLMSGDVRPDQLRLALLQGKADAVLAKPWNSASLMDTVLPLVVAAQ